MPADVAHARYWTLCPHLPSEPPRCVVATGAASDCLAGAMTSIAKEDPKNAEVGEDLKACAAALRKVRQVDISANVVAAFCMRVAREL
jgi:hypothetical protein